MIYADVISGRGMNGITEEDRNGWVELHESSRILKNGLFIHISERDGYQHIYLERPNGRFTVPVTSGQWEVNEIVHVDEQRELVYFTANKRSALESHLYRVRFDGTDLMILTPEPGCHNISMHPNGLRFVDTYSSIDQPTTIKYRNSDGTLVRVLGEANISSISLNELSIEDLDIKSIAAE